MVRIRSWVGTGVHYLLCRAIVAVALELCMRSFLPEGVAVGVFLIKPVQIRVVRDCLPLLERERNAPFAAALRLGIFAGNTVGPRYYTIILPLGYGASGMAIDVYIAPVAHFVVLGKRLG